MNETKKILESVKTVAVVGLSPRESRPSHQVARFLQSAGYRIIPVNPYGAGSDILGEAVYASVADIPSEIDVDMVDVFRRSDHAGEAVDAAIARGVDAVWMQLGVIDHDAAARAEAAGLKVAMDRCPAIEYRRYF